MFHILTVKKKNKSSDKDLKKALIMCAYNDETFGTYKSALQESMLNQLGYTNVATGPMIVLIASVIYFSTYAYGRRFA